MPDFEFEFNQQDKDLVLNQTDEKFGGDSMDNRDYIRLTIYPSEAINNIVTLPGTDKQAIFYSSLHYTSFDINISPFGIGTDVFNTYPIGGDINNGKGGDFKIYRTLDSDGNPLPNSDIYIKPNEIFNDFELPQGDYKIQIDFLNQVSPPLDGNNDPDEDPNPTSDSANHYQFIIKQISTSRKEVRLKLLDKNIENNSQDILDITNQLNNGEPEFLDDGVTPNPNYKYQFKHVLNIGTGDHNPIMNYAFDAVTDGKDNQSIILKLYEPLPTNVGNLSMVTIEKEVLTTQIQDIFYFSDVPDVFFGDGLNSQPQEDWINPDGNNFGFQNLDEIAISASIDNIEVDSLISGSEYGYPNLNTDFNEYENHTFFGSAKKKLQNFKTKVETIQGYYSDISSSLSSDGGAIDGDSTFIIQKRKNLFNKINKEIQSFTPYEKFLYYDAQSESTASAPSLKNYAPTIPVGPEHDGIELNQYDGFNVVYQRTNDTASIIEAGITPGSQKYVGISTSNYMVHEKPLFNYSSSVYLSFVMKGDETIDYSMGATKELKWDKYGMTTAGNGLGVPLPQNIHYQERLVQPPITGSEYRRFIYHSSMSYWIPNEGIDFHDLPTNEDQGEIVQESSITILHGSVKTGSYQVKDSTGKYPTTVLSSSSGIPFYGSCMPAGELFRLYFRGDLGGITSSFMTDVRLTLKDPSDVYPFDNVFKTTSNEWTTWYNSALTQAENFDTDNIHSFENNLPLYIQESSDYNDMKDFLALQGEQYDLIRNHIDSLGTLHNRGYKKTDSPPDNTLPMLLSNMGWQSINPFEGNLTETLGSYLSGVTTIDDIKNNTWRKTLNNLLYIYKSKGTKNSVRALLNTYGYPPDLLKFQEFGGVADLNFGTIDDVPLTDDDVLPVIYEDYRGEIDTNLDLSTGSFNFTTNKNKFYRYRFAGKQNRILNLDWWMDNADINTFEFVYKHDNTTNTQTILESSGSGGETLWDLRLVPSSDGFSSSFQFRLNNSETGSLAIASNAVSMSTTYVNISDGQLWNVMLQRMTGSTSTNITNEYRLHSTLQNNKTIETYNYITMSVAGEVSSTGSNNIANKNWMSSGSRHYLSSSNLFVGETLTGSLGELRGWSSALSTSKFRQHTFNKFSIVGNTILSHCKELVYHYKLNENYGQQTDTISGSGVVHPISSSTQNMQIVDSAHEFGNYNLTKQAHIFLTSSVYGFDIIDSVQPTLQDNLSSPNDNNILINPNRSVVGNLSPGQDAVLSLTDKSNGKQKLIVSPKLELYRSPQNFVNDFILSRLSGFNLEKKYGNPINFYSQSYKEFDTFREEFFDCYEIKTDINKFIRSHESMFNHSLSEGLKQLIPARSTFSDKNSNFGVEIKPTILEKQKYEHHHHTVEINPNTGTGSIDVVSKTHIPSSNYETIKEGTIQGAPTSIGSYEQPLSASIKVSDSGSNGNPYLGVAYTSLSSSIVNPFTGSISPSPSLNESSVPTSKDGTIDYASRANESYKSVHKNWGTSSADVHHINFAGGTGSYGTFNTYDIETRFVFHSIGDNEYYSGSIGNTTDFTDSSRFYNRLMIDTDFHANVTYESIINGNIGAQSGRMMGKTRYFSSSIAADSTTTDFFPRNHVSKFSNPFKDRMYQGAQNITNSGSSQLNVQEEDYSSASFYRVKVTGGDNQLIVRSGNPGIGSDDKIIYDDNSGGGGAL